MSVSQQVESPRLCECYSVRRLKCSTGDYSGGDVWTGLVGPTAEARKPISLRRDCSLAWAYWFRTNVRHVAPERTVSSGCAHNEFERLFGTLCRSTPTEFAGQLSCYSYWNLACRHEVGICFLRNFLVWNAFLRTGQITNFHFRLSLLICHDWPR